MRELVAVGSFCPNENCPDYGKVEVGNIIRYGKSNERRQRFQCKTCRKTFNERSGTLFYNRKTKAEDILECLALLAEGVWIRCISRVKGIKEDTILSFLREAAHHAEQVAAILLNDYRTSQTQIDGLWTYAGREDARKSGLTRTRRVNIGGVRPGTENALAVGRGVGQTKIQAAIALWQQVKARAAYQDSPPPVLSDGWGGHSEGLLEVYGQVPPYTGRGRRPSRKQPAADWHYTQMVKQRDATGNLIGIDGRVIYGNETTLQHTGERTTCVQHSNAGRDAQGGLCLGGCRV